MSSGFEPARLKVETYPFGHGRLPTVKIVFENQNSVKFELANKMFEKICQRLDSNPGLQELTSLP